MAKRRGHGEGSIYQRADGRWTGSVDFGWEDGKRKRKAVYGKTRQEVVSRIAQLTADKAKGISPADDRLTVAQFLELWLERTAKPNVRPLTWSSYEQIVRLHLVPELGKTRLSKLSPSDVEGFMARKQAEGLSARTVQYAHAVLRAALKTAVRDGKVHRNVAALVSAPKVSRDPVKPLEIEEAQKFMKAAKSDPLEALWTITLALGLRRGEVLGLRWQDCDLKDGRLWVRQALQRQKDKGLVAVEPKSRTSRRSLPLPPFAVAALKNQHKRQKEQRLAAGPDWQETEYVFTLEDGRPMTPERVYKAFCEFLKQAGLQHFRFHDLRHSCASLLFAQGCELRLVQEILGHSAIGLTANTYTHLLPEGDRKAANAMESVLGSAR